MGSYHDLPHCQGLRGGGAEHVAGAGVEEHLVRAQGVHGVVGLAVEAQGEAVAGGKLHHRLLISPAAVYVHPDGLPLLRPGHPLGHAAEREAVADGVEEQQVEELPVALAPQNLRTRNPGKQM